MARSFKRPLSRDRAWACVTWNFSVSGLGTLRAGRVFSGVCQLGSLFAGVGFLCAWTIEKIHYIIQSGMGETAPSPAAWLWKGAVISVAISWSWMLLSCVSLMRQAMTEEKKNQRDAPPRLEDLPKKNSENQ